MTFSALRQPIPITPLTSPMATLAKLSHHITEKTSWTDQHTGICGIVVEVVHLATCSIRTIEGIPQTSNAVEITHPTKIG